MVLDYLTAFFVKTLSNLKIDFTLHEDEDKHIYVDIFNLPSELDIRLLNARFQKFDGEIPEYINGRKEPVMRPVYSYKNCCIPLGDKSDRYLRIKLDTDRHNKMLKVEYVIRNFFNEKDNLLVKALY